MKKLILILLMLPLFGFANQDYLELYGDNWNWATYDKMLQGRDLFGQIELPTYIINKCKQAETDVLQAGRCVEFAFAIAFAETGGCERTINCWGMLSGNNLGFQNRFQAFDRWLWSYERFWFGHKTARDFIVKSRYCIHDTLHDGTNNGCPNWQKNVNFYLVNFK